MIREMSSGDKKDGKKSKLSLRKKTNKNREEKKEGTRHILTAPADLNETCEFKEPATFKSISTLSRKQKTTTTSGENDASNDLKSGDEGSACSDTETVTCHVCDKVLTHMSQTGRHQHVNRCIDQKIVEEQTEREHQELLERARTAVLDCPMCGRPFRSNTTKLSHLKRCSKELSVGPDMLLKLRRDQEAERHAMLDKGLLPDTIRNLKLKSTAPSKTRKVKEPKSQFQEDVQVAKAISSSLAERDKHLEKNLLPDRETTDKGKSSKRGKKKTVYEEVCLLTSLSDTDRQRRLEEKVGNILQHYDSEDVQIKLLSSHLAIQGDDDRAGSLWARCAQTPEHSPVEVFYVRRLVPPLVVNKSSQYKTNKKVKIPGREVTFIEDKTATHNQRDVSYSTEGDDIITASTQTAVVLAELAMEDDNMSLHNSLDVTAADTSVLSGTQSMGFCVKTMAMKEQDQVVHSKETVEAYRKLVNNADYSDVSLVTTDGHSLHAHKLILSVRCPALLQREENGRIQFECTADAALSLLQYIYTGELTLTTPVTDMKTLARKLELPALDKVCENLDEYTEDADINLITEANGITADSPQIPFRSSIDLKGIWGESDSDEDIVDTDSACQTEIEEQDYQEIRSTQRRHASLHENSDTDTGNRSVQDHGSVQMEIEDGLLADESKSKLEEDITDNKEDLNDLDKTVCDTSQLMERNTEVIQRNNKRPIGERDSAVELNTYKEQSKYNADSSIVLSSDDELIPSPKRAKLFNDSIDKLVDSNSEIFEQEKSNSEGNHDNIIYEREEKKASETEIGVNKSNSSLDYSGADLFCSPSPDKQRRDAETTRAESYSGINVRDKESTVKQLTNELDNESEKSRKLDSGSETDRQLDSRSFLSGKSVEDSIVLSDSEPDNLDDKFDIDSSPSRCKNVVSANENHWHLQHFSTEETSNSSVTNESLNTNLHKKNTLKSPQSQYNSSDCDGTIGKSIAPTEFDEGTEVNCDNFVKLKQISHKTDMLGDKRKQYADRFDENTKDSIYLNKSLQNDQGSNECTHLKDNSEECQSDNDDIDFNPDLENVEIDKTDIDESSVTDKPGDRDKLYGGSKEIVEIDSDNSPEKLDRNKAKTDSIDTGSTSTDSSGYEEIRLTEGELIQNNTDLTDVKDKTDSDKDLLNNSNAHTEIDVWSDFNDDGMVDIPSVDSPQCPSDLEVHDTGCELNTSFPDGEDSFVFHVDEAAAPTVNASSQPKARFVTPTLRGPQSKQKTQKHAWEPPSPFTPMPEYEKMATPALKKAVQRFGVKPVGKKRMVKVLTDIYHQTHQYETDSDCEAADVELEDSSSEAGSDTAASQQLSQESRAMGDVFEESCLHMVSSDSDTSSSPQKAVDVSRQLTDYFRRNPALNKRVLLYEPLELDVLKKELKEAKLKCSMDKLVDFLDERCIAFTTKNSRNSRRGRQKKRSPKKTVTASPKKQRTARPKLAKTGTLS